MQAAEYAYGVKRRAMQAGAATDQDKLDARSAIDFINEFDPIVSAMQIAKRGKLSGLGLGVEEKGTPAAATLELHNQDRQSAGGIVAASDQWGQVRGHFGATFAEVEMAGSLFVDNYTDWRNTSEAQLRALIDTGVTDGAPGDAGYFLPTGQPITPRARTQRLFVRDLISVQGTSLASVPYIREWTPTLHELGASAVGEGLAKPEVILAFENDDAPVRKIAAWVPATTEILDDAATLRGYIDNRLAYMLALREEWDIIRGSGVAPNLKGILNFTGVQPLGAGEVAVNVGVAIGMIENVDGEANGAVMNPTKYWGAVTTRNANQFDGGFGTGAPFSAPFGTLWGLPVIRSRTMAATKGLVGSFNLGATLFDRMRTIIRVGNQHSDFFVTNKVAILAEERVALAVHRPDFFVDVTFS